MNVIVAPASFKGSLSAAAAAAAIAAGVRASCPRANVRTIPLADGGEGTLDAIAAALPSQRRQVPVQNADATPTIVDYLLLDDDTVVIEAAQIVGYGQSQRPVAARTSAGIGELIRILLERNFRRLTIGIGGTSTNDGGVGLLAALGVRFTDRDNCAVEANMNGLMRLARVDFSTLDPRIFNCDIAVLADVDNPLLGEYGATSMYGAQKGVTARERAPFDAALKNFADLCRHATGKDLVDAGGSGAAGGIGYALQLLGARMQRGAETIARLAGLPAALHNGDIVFTGEGRADAQTAHGKSPALVARYARAAGVPIALLAGSIATDVRAMLERHFDYCAALSTDTDDIAAAMRDASQRLTQLAARVALELRLS